MIVAFTARRVKPGSQHDFGAASRAASMRTPVAGSTAATRSRACRSAQSKRQRG